MRRFLTFYAVVLYNEIDVCICGLLDLSFTVQYYIFLRRIYHTACTVYLTAS